ncbi:MAG: hypothetical protein COB67_08010 [SAR324 cluster bacterium]|uniref:OmpA-like domain-containing protein n=1 Tax=SAR324 cluster bacterium TaxID=2024889 RepID=A0A2A4T3F6_9DELT|nr:MAG: hypothetical protein COB67_08010 [SAR324 cluster bacterium]
MKQLFYAALISVFIASCGGSKPAPVKQESAKQEPVTSKVSKKEKKVVFLEEEDAEETVVSQEILDENKQVIQKHQKEEAQIVENTLTDEKEQEKIQSENQVLAKETKVFQRKALEKYKSSIKDEEVKELIENKKIAIMLGTAKTSKELARMLREDTDLQLDEQQIEKIIDFKKVRDKIIASADAEALQQVLQEETSMSTEDIKELVADKKVLAQKVQSQKSKTLSRIYARLKRNRELGLELAFCMQSSSLDQTVIKPIYYTLDDFVVNKDDVNNLFDDIDAIYDTLEQYPDMVLLLVGKTDARGANLYNKGLGDRRWTGVVRQLEVQLEESRYQGVSKGEECHSERNGSDLKAWWAENRKTEFIWALK